MVNTRNIYPLTSKVFFGLCFQFFSYSMVVLNSLFFQFFLEISAEWMNF